MPMQNTSIIYAFRLVKLLVEEAVYISPPGGFVIRDKHGISCRCL